MPIRGETIGTAYVRVLADGSGFDDDLEKQSAKAGKDAGKAYGREFDKESKSWEKAWMDRLMDNLAARNKVMVSENRKFRGQITKITKGMLVDIKVLEKFTDDWRLSIQRTARAFEDAEFAFTKPLSNYRLALLVAQKKTREFGNRAGSIFDTAALRSMFFFDAVSRGAEKARTKLDETRDHFDRLGDSIGRAFGKGSRNNFLNFMGAFVGKMASLPGLLAGAGSGIINFGNRIKTTFDKAGGGVSGLFASLGLVVRSAALAGGALIGLTAIIGIFTSAAVLASGVVIALASSLSFALVGAIGLLAGAMVPLVAGLGVAIAGFASMDKAAKDSFKGVTDAFKGLGDTAADTMFKDIGASAQALEGVIKGLNPLVEALAGAVRDVFDGWIKGVSSKEFQGFVHNLSSTLPDMIRSLGEIAGNVGQGLANIWIVASPFVQEFLGWLAGVTQGFADLNTVQGGKLDTFFDNVSESVKAVAGFLEQVISLTATFFAAGKDTGDSIFRDIGDAIEGWVTHLKENPDILENFFADAKKFAGALGNVVEGAAKLIDTLDSPATRDFAISLTEGIGDGLKLLADLLGPVVGLLNEMDSSARNVAIGLGIFAAAFPGLSGKIVSTSGNLSSMGRNLTDTSTKMQRFAAGAQGLAGLAGLGLLTDSLVRTEGAAGTLEATVGGAALGFAVGGPVGAGIGAAAGLLVGLIENFDSTTDAARDAYNQIGAIDPVEEATDSMKDLKDSLDQVTGAYTENTRAAVLKKLQDQGLMEVADKYKISSREMVNAALGQGDAWRTTNPIIADLSQKIKDADQALIDITTNSDNFTDTGLSAAATEDATAIQKHKKELQEDLAVLTKMPGELGRMARELQSTTAVTTDFTGKLKGIPRKIQSKIEATGIIPTTAGVANIARQYKLLDRKKIKTLISASGADTTVRQVRRLINTLDDAGKRHPKPKVTVDVDKPSNNIESMKRKLTDVGKVNAKPKAGLDDNVFTKGIKAVQEALNAADKKQVSPKIKVDPTDSHSTITGVQTSLNAINDETVYINVVRRGGKGAAGGIFSGATNMTIGEAGPEALVPLNRPLAQVDPAVRELSAIAQGLATTATPTATRAAVDMGGVTIITPTKDPAAVAQEVMNRLVAVGY